MAARDGGLALFLLKGLTKPQLADSAGLPHSPTAMMVKGSHALSRDAFAPQKHAQHVIRVLRKKIRSEF